MSFNDAYFIVRKRKRRCRFCGREFTTTSPARKTCTRPECREKSLALIKEQNRKAQERYMKRKRRKYVMNLSTTKKGN